MSVEAKKILEEAVTQLEGCITNAESIINEENELWVNMIISDCKHAIRVVCKLRDLYLCPGCGERNDSAGEMIQYFKALWHKDCLARVKGE